MDSADFRVVVLDACWVGGISLAWAARNIEPLRSWARYGKLNGPWVSADNQDVSAAPPENQRGHGNADREAMGSAWWMWCDTSKCFTSYYAVAVVLNMILLTDVFARWLMSADEQAPALHELAGRGSLRRLVCGEPPPHGQRSTDLLGGVIVMYLFQAHAARRLYECVAVHVFSGQKQHVMVLIGGRADCTVYSHWLPTCGLDR